MELQKIDIVSFLSQLPDNEVVTVKTLKDMVKFSDKRETERHFKKLDRKLQELQFRQAIKSVILD